MSDGDPRWEGPGARGEGPGARGDEPGERHCSICGDDAQPARVLSLDEASNTALVEYDCGQATVAIDLLEDVRVGETVMVHLGFAIGRMVAEQQEAP